MRPEQPILAGTWYRGVLTLLLTSLSDIGIHGALLHRLGTTHDRGGVPRLQAGVVGRLREHLKEGQVRVSREKVGAERRPSRKRRYQQNHSGDDSNDRLTDQKNTLRSEDRQAKHFHAAQQSAKK